VKLEGKPLLQMEATLTFDQAELRLLSSLAANPDVLKAVAGKDPLPDRSEPWEKLLRAIRQETEDALARFKGASEVFEGRKIASEPRRRAVSAEDSDE
jgi:hypothetical protein